MAQLDSIDCASASLLKKGEVKSRGLICGSNKGMPHHPFSAPPQKKITRRAGFDPPAGLPY